MPPIGRENLKRPALLIRDRVRLVQKPTIKTLTIDSALTQFMLNLSIALDDSRFVSSAPIHRPSSRFHEQSVEFRLAVASTQDESTASMFDLLS